MKPILRGREVFYKVLRSFAVIMRKFHENYTQLCNVFHDGNFFFRDSKIIFVKVSRKHIFFCERHAKFCCVFAKKTQSFYCLRDGNFFFVTIKLSSRKFHVNIFFFAKGMQSFVAFSQKRRKVLRRISPTRVFCHYFT